METIDFNEVIRDNIEVVGELLPEATYSKKGLMSSYYPTKFQNISWAAPDTNSRLIKIADMKKQSGLIIPLVMFAYEKHAQQTSTFFFLSIVNRSEGVFRSR